MMTAARLDMPRPPRLLEQVSRELRLRHDSLRTEEAYCAWIRRYVHFHHLRHPRDLGTPEITAFLSSMATEKNVAASTQNQALAALLFLYTRVLGMPFEELKGLVDAKRPRRLPVVLNPDEVATLLDRMT
jgi:site-specific recombinase XerD